MCLKSCSSRKGEKRRQGPKLLQVHFSLLVISNPAIFRMPTIVLLKERSLLLCFPSLPIHNVFLRGQGNSSTLCLKELVSLLLFFFYPSPLLVLHYLPIAKACRTIQRITLSVSPSNGTTTQRQLG